MQQQTLNGSGNFDNSMLKNGCPHTDLLALGRIPDPFAAASENRLTDPSTKFLYSVSPYAVTAEWGLYFQCSGTR